ncbi:MULTISPECIES: PD-(D/E)XK nuclease family transposase [unclassified Treponema]|uniref:PD-(D/E)XK nuclease family transposase n=1 Tax=unclassified Treponema TaxID=2638727 RepID=UPI0020A5BEBA|nr:MULTISPECIES: PD-(D/E)XK nuclease family transposase [unclassified Treponema]UTC66431.1 PD-(D/E)XK nuclease family transposase [Treponema sp. OMZ 789]UTC69162.1 PD-(D/E)XK nuclease family transposase [Treponema sp. OMZ 790]UTC71875.1 PD-(D/E)XK nuclease family transposase [Treponema sp. OMZ 791]
MSEEKILNPKTDWVFKLMFSKGEEGNKALISFLNAFLEDSYGKIKKAEILNTELIRDRPSGETYRLDFLIKTDTGLLVDLEMQQFWKTNYPRRSQMYLMRLASRFLKTEPKEDDFLYAISLSVFGCDVPKNAELVRMPEGSVIQYLYVELNELIVYTMKKRLEEYNLKDFWIRFLANYEEDKKSGMLEELCRLEEGIKMAEATLFRVTDEERRMAIELSNEKYEMYVECERNEARRLGLEEGRAAGLEEGLAEGRAEGRNLGLAEGLAEGRAAGSHQKALETAKIMKNMNYPLEDIYTITGLSEEVVGKL